MSQFSQSELNDGLKAGSRATTWTPRINAMQLQAIERSIVGLSLTDEQIAQCDRFAVTGDMSQLSRETHAEITARVKIAKSGLSESQAKRIWPRKMAVVIVANS